MDSVTRDGLEKNLNYCFRESSLLLSALSHKSYVNENPGHTGGNNERLEFLGDAVLDLVVSDRMFRRYPGLAEGEMTRVRAEVVSEKNLAAIGRSLDLGVHLLLGKGERLTGGHDKDSLLADALEAVIGAIYLDGGYTAVRDTVIALLSDQVDMAVDRKRGLDYKTRLQELVQARYGTVPRYVVLETRGPDHGRVYQVGVSFAEYNFGPGTGRTKKNAEQDVARLALKGLDE